MTEPIPLDAHPHKATLTAMLRSLADDERRERIAIGDLLDALGDRALAALLFVFALPNVLPMPPGTSAILGAPLLFLAAQMATSGRPSAVPPNQAASSSPGRVSTIVEAWQDGVGICSAMNSACCADMTAANTVAVTSLALLMVVCLPEM